MKRSIFFLASMCCGAVFSAAAAFLPDNTLWIPTTFSGRESVKFKRGKGEVFQTHLIPDGRSLFHTQDIELPPGKYTLAVELLTDGTAAIGGGANISVQMIHTRRRPKTLFTVTKGVFEEVELDFEVKEADKSLRIWLEQENFKGTTCFRNVRINKQRPRSPYRVLEKRLLRAGKVLCNTEPGRTYRISIGNNAAGKVHFVDQDLRKLSELPVKNGSVFYVPEETMQNFVSVDRACRITVEEVIEEVRSFSWMDWNSYHVYGPYSGGRSYRKILLKTLPEYAITRVFMNADLYVNGVFAGSGDRGYNNLYYHNITALLKKGENILEIRYPDKKNPEKEVLSVDVEFRFSDGSRKVFLSSSGKWINVEKDGSEKIAGTFVMNRFFPALFDKNWVAPSAVPERILPKRKVDILADFPQKNVEAGTPLCGKISLTFREMPFFDTGKIELLIRSKQGKKVWKQWLFPDKDLTALKAKDELTLPVTLATYFIPAGEYTLTLGERFNFAEITDFSVTGVYKEERKESKFVTSGCMDMLEVDGKKIVPAIYYGWWHFNYSCSRNLENEFYKMRQSGYKIFNILSFFGSDIVKNNYKERGTVWLGMNKYDFSMIDHHAEQLLSAVPDARMIFYINCSIPSWWPQMFPEHAVVWDDGTIAPYASFASEKFRQDLTVALDATLKYIASRPWSSRIIGFYFGCGYDNQWFQPMDYGKKQRFADYSKAMENKFRSFLQKKYRTDDALRSAWGNRTVTLETAQIPSRKDRLGKRGYYLDPVLDRNVIDFLHCTSEQTDEIIALLKNAVKRNIGNIPVGTYYIPYDVTYVNAQSRRPSLDDIYSKNALDFAAAPLGYDAHALNQCGPGSIFSVDRTMKLNNVFFIGEDDVRTFRSMPKNPRWGNPDSFGTLAGMRRNSGKKLVSGHGFWSCDIYGHWYDSVSVRKLLSRELLLMEALSCYNELPELNANAVKVTKVGTYLHKRANTAVDLKQVHFPTKSILPPSYALDSVNLRDLGHKNLPAYNMYIFDDTFALDSEDLKKIDKLKKNHNILVFTHASGYSDGKTLSAANISKLTGIKIKETFPGIDLSPMPWRVAPGNPVFAGLADKKFDPPPAKRFTVDDPGAIPLGRYRDDDSVAAALKDFGSYTVIYLPNAFPDITLINALGKYSQQHIFTDSPVFVKSRGRLITVYCPVESASGVLNLPGNFAAVEVFSGKTFPVQKKIDFQLRFGETALYFLGSPAEVAGFCRETERVRE